MNTCNNTMIKMHIYIYKKIPIYIYIYEVATDKKRGVFSKEKPAVECVFVCLSVCV